MLRLLTTSQKSCFFLREKQQSHRLTGSPKGNTKTLLRNTFRGFKHSNAWCLDSPHRIHLIDIVAASKQRNRKSKAVSKCFGTWRNPTATPLHYTEFVFYACGTTKAHQCPRCNLTLLEKWTEHALLPTSNFKGHPCGQRISPNLRTLETKEIF